MKTFDFGRYLLGGFVAAAMLAGCGGSQPPIGALGAMPQSSRSLNVTHSARPATKSADTKWFLYVGIQNAIGETQFEVYPLGARKPVREYGGTLGPVTMVLDPWNDIYTTDNNPSGGRITAYTPGGRSVLLGIDGYPSRGLAFDAKGNLYATWLGGFVAKYAPRSTKQIRTIKASGDALAVDSKGNLYVGQLGGSGSHAAVLVFPRGAKKPTRTITTGIHVPVALLVDKSNDLYVANCNHCYYRPGSGSVTEYAYGNSTPLRTITDGIDSPMAMALGTSGLLFVANYGFFGSGSVTVYSSGTAPVRRITAGIRNPDALAVGPNGYLYVANCASSKGRDSITAYTPDGSRLVLRITDGASRCPLSIAIGKGR
jgi:hypothetical protein